MNWKIFLEKISNFENSIDISKLKYFDFNPWPYVRLSVFNKWSIENTARIQKETERARKTENIILIIFKSFFRYIKNPIRRADVDIIYFTHLSWFKEPLENKVFDKNADSFWYFFSKDYKIKNIELSNHVWENHRLYFKKDVTYLYFILVITRIKNKLRSYLKPEKPSLYDELNQEIKKNFGFQVDVAAELAFINYLSKVFMRILTCYKPRLVFLAVFYCPNSMAISLACHRLGIRVVEYQHGAPNEYHAMYTNWNNMPYKGYELIPDIFWTWGESSKSIVEKWAKNTTKHKAIIGGNLWMTYFKYSDVGTNIENLTKLYNKSKINILVSLQGDEFFPYFIFDNIKSSSSTITWHFRNHPSLLISEGLKNQITEFSNTEINFSSNALLYNLLKLINIHITSFSTVAFEAQSFNIPTIFTHINALNGYEHLINKNGLYYADTSEKLKMLINKISDCEEKIKPDHIISDLATHKSVLSMLME